MDLANQFEAVVNHLLIEEMISLNNQDEVPMVSALMCIVTHWTRLIMSYDIRL